jgi:hypothetical protein
MATNDERSRVELSERERQIALLALHELAVDRSCLELGNASNLIPLLRVGADEIKKLAERFDGRSGRVVVRSDAARLNTEPGRSVGVLDAFISTTVRCWDRGQEVRDMTTNYQRPQIESRQPITSPLIGVQIGSGVPLLSAAFRRAEYVPPRIDSRERIEGALIILLSGVA